MKDRDRNCDRVDKKTERSVQKRLLKQIRRSAETVSVPERLLPENIEELLGTQGAGEGSGFAGKREVFSVRRRHLLAGMAAAAAVLTLFVSAGIYLRIADMESAGIEEAVSEAGGLQTEEIGPEAGGLSAEEIEPEAGGLSAEEIGPEADGLQSEEGRQEAQGGVFREEEALKDRVSAPRRDAGELYRVAEDYGQIYDVIMTSRYLYPAEDIIVADGAAPQMGVGGTPAAGAPQAENSAVMQEGIQDMAADAARPGIVQEKQASYSGTNLQTEGIDESDIIKTDGSFLYTVRNDRVYITDIREGKMTGAGVVAPPLSASGQILELYVDKDRLLLIAEERTTVLNRQSQEKTDAAVLEEELVVCVDSAQISTDANTVLYTYDIKNRQEPRLLGQVRQEGVYHTSRKKGDMVYLFTGQELAVRCLNSTREDVEWIPLINGSPVAEDAVYLPERGSYGELIASVDIKAPDRAVDSILIVNDHAEVYVGQEAIYLYYSQWSNGEYYTEIASFSYEEGRLDAKGADSVKGMVRDTFAVSEYQGGLRLLTTDADRERGSYLYLFDEKLSLLGRLEGIAPGEEVYAARFLGDMAYFVTYRNVDPLFAADLSDPTEPRLVGELKITGYSEYLHSWGEDRLLGIGYETDPDSGERKGIKLTMFDVTKGAELKTLDSVVLRGAEDTPAVSQYKAVLADRAANLIGFAVSTPRWNEQGGFEGYENQYLLYEWSEGGFKRLLDCDISEEAANYRGIYAGDRFYLAGPAEVTGFDRQHDYRKLQTYRYGEE